MEFKQDCVYSMKEEATMKTYFVLSSEQQQTQALLNQKGSMKWSPRNVSQQPLHYIRALAVTNDIKLLVKNVVVV